MSNVQIDLFDYIDSYKKRKNIHRKTLPSRILRRKQAQILEYFDCKESLLRLRRRLSRRLMRSKSMNTENTDKQADTRLAFDWNTEHGNWEWHYVKNPLRSKQ